jgi:hypothetical protein
MYYRQTIAYSEMKNRILTQTGNFVYCCDSSAETKIVTSAESKVCTVCKTYLWRNSVAQDVRLLGTVLFWQDGVLSLGAHEVHSVWYFVCDDNWFDGELQYCHPNFPDLTPNDFSWVDTLKVWFMADSPTHCMN